MFAPRVGKRLNAAAKSNTPPHVSSAPKAMTERHGSREVEQKHSHFLQPPVGDQSTPRLLSQLAEPPAGSRPGGRPQQEAERMPQSGPAPGASWDFSEVPSLPRDRASGPQAPSRLSVAPIAGIIQRKLVIGAVNDPLEH